jgi:hypothetical protein
MVYMLGRPPNRWVLELGTGTDPGLRDQGDLLPVRAFVDLVFGLSIACVAGGQSERFRVGKENIERPSVCFCLFWSLSNA